MLNNSLVEDLYDKYTYVFHHRNKQGLFTLDIEYDNILYDEEDAM
jgi:hypothetical protein